MLEYISKPIVSLQIELNEAPSKGNENNSSRGSWTAMLLATEGYQRLSRQIFAFAVEHIYTLGVQWNLCEVATHFFHFSYKLLMPTSIQRTQNLVPRVAA